MGLNNFQYNQLLRDYDLKRQKNRHILDDRKDEIYKNIPQYEKTEQEIITLSINEAKASLMGDSGDLDTYRQRLLLLSKKKKDLLLSNGYPIDYLDPVYDCPDCQDTGFIENKRCHCFKQAIVDFLYEQGNLGTILQHENFSNFNLDFYDNTQVDPEVEMTPYENIKDVYVKCQEFIDTFDECYSNLFIYGNTGVGKTFLANCIAKELLDTAHTVVYLTAFELFDILEKNKFSNDSLEKNVMSERFHYILESDLLIIDDLGTELVNSFSASQIYLCINERHLNQKHTIISTNLSVDEIRAFYSERVLSRIFLDYRMLKIVGDDIRHKKALLP